MIEFLDAQCLENYLNLTQSLLTLTAYVFFFFSMMLVYLTVSELRWAREGTLKRFWMRSGGQAWPSHRNIDWPFSSKNIPVSLKRSSEQRTAVGIKSLATSMECWRRQRRSSRPKTCKNVLFNSNFLKSFKEKCIYKYILTNYVLSLPSHFKLTD